MLHGTRVGDEFTRAPLKIKQERRKSPLEKEMSPNNSIRSNYLTILAKEILLLIIHEGSGIRRSGGATTRNSKKKYRRWEIPLRGKKQGKSECGGVM
jgi:hypothetical protein